MNSKQYPLQWPIGRNRVQTPERSKFKPSTISIEAELNHMFASAWQDGVYHLNPEYIRRDTVFTERAIKLITAHTNKQVGLVLDRLKNNAVYAEWGVDNSAEIGNAVPTYMFEAEYNRLKESKND